MFNKSDNFNKAYLDSISGVDGLDARLVPAKFENKIKDLKMKPEDWFQLNLTLNNDDVYRKIVNDYQKRENDLLPTCTADFPVCPYLTDGRHCNCKTECKFQRR